MNLFDLVPVASLTLLAWLMYRDGYRLRRTPQTIAVLAVAAVLAYAGWVLLTTPARQVAQLIVFLGLFILFGYWSSPSLVTRRRGRTDNFGATLLRVDADIARAHLDAIERGRAGLISNTEAIDIYRNAVDQLRLLVPPCRPWKALTDERIALHERNLAFLSAPDDFEGRIPANRAESEAWRARVAARMAARN